VLIDLFSQRAAEQDHSANPVELAE
jgi:hypothetical protein